MVPQHLDRRVPKGYPAPTFGSPRNVVESFITRRPDSESQGITAFRRYVPVQILKPRLPLITCFMIIRQSTFGIDGRHPSESVMFPRRHQIFFRRRFSYRFGIKPEILPNFTNSAARILHQLLKIQIKNTMSASPQTAGIAPQPPRIFHHTQRHPWSAEEAVTQGRLTDACDNRRRLSMNDEETRKRKISCNSREDICIVGRFFANHEGFWTGRMGRVECDRGLLASRVARKQCRFDAVARNAAIPEVQSFRPIAGCLGGEEPEAVRLPHQGNLGMRVDQPMQQRGSGSEHANKEHQATAVEYFCKGFHGLDFAFGSPT